MPIYMHIKGISGTATGAYKDWFEVDSATFSGTGTFGSSGSSGTIDTSGVGRPGTSEILVTKYPDSTSTQLLRLSLWGEAKPAKIDFVPKKPSKAAPYLSIELENMLISSYTVKDLTDSPKKSYEEITLNFTKIRYNTKGTSTPKDEEDVNLKAKWDLAK